MNSSETSFIPLLTYIFVKILDKLIAALLFIIINHLIWSSVLQLLFKSFKSSISFIQFESFKSLLHNYLSTPSLLLCVHSLFLSDRHIGKQSECNSLKDTYKRFLRIPIPILLYLQFFSNSLLNGQKCHNLYTKPTLFKFTK